MAIHPHQNNIRRWTMKKIRATFAFTIILLIMFPQSRHFHLTPILSKELGVAQIGQRFGFGIPLTLIGLIIIIPLNWQSVYRYMEQIDGFLLVYKKFRSFRAHPLCYNFCEKAPCILIPTVACLSSHSKSCDLAKHHLHQILTRIARKIDVPWEFNPNRCCFYLSESFYYAF